MLQQDLLRSVWGPSYGRESNYLRVYANQLRRKLEPDPSAPRHLITEPGLGYRFTPDRSRERRPRPRSGSSEQCVAGGVSSARGRRGR